MAAAAITGVRMKLFFWWRHMESCAGLASAVQDEKTRSHPKASSPERTIK